MFGEYSKEWNWNSWNDYFKVIKDSWRRTILSDFMDSLTYKWLVADGGITINGDLSKIAKV